MPDTPRVAIVTGGAAGIGKACALRLAGEGAAVVLADVNAQAGQATREQIERQGGQAIFLQADMGRAADCQATAQAALDAWGRLDVLVANAGVRVYGSILEATDADWDAILRVNLRGVSDCCKAVLPTMIEQRRGSIVIVSSVHALAGRADMPLYDATKAASLSLTRSLAVAHGKDGIRVNAVCPGLTITDFHEARAAQDGLSPEQLRQAHAGYALLGRTAEPAEIASAVAFLAGDDASMITGQALMVDGGYSVP